MSELLGKLSSYNIFNYLLPGVVFAVIGSDILHYPITQHDIVLGAFLYYFIGLVISRFGSLVIEPVLKGISLIEFADYSNFVMASKKDAQIEVLSEANNTYRTFCSLFASLLLLKGYVWIESKFPSLKNWDAILLVTVLLALFIFSYKKQSGYVAKRVAIALDNSGTAEPSVSSALPIEKSDAQKAGA